MKNKKFLVSQVKQDMNYAGIEVDGKKRLYNGGTRHFYVSDPGEAREINESVGMRGSKDFIVSEVPTTNKEGVHTYSFRIRKPECKQEGCKRLPAESNGYCPDHQPKESK